LQAALVANNVFHPLTYEGAVDLDSIDNPVERAGLEAQVSFIIYIVFYYLIIHL
jgi:factor associated with neutral sphingomyelinase activation